MPKYAVVEDALIEEMLFMVLRMVIAACGGLVLSQVAVKTSPKADPAHRGDPGYQ